MKFSNFYAPTTKDAPKDAVLASHIFLSRAGYIAQVGSGLYNFLPLGKIVFDKVRTIVKEEMDKSGAIEVMMNVVTPASLWQESGRLSVFGAELLRLKDRKTNDFLLSPTHEEVIVDMVRNKITSYKQLPLHLYQISTKFRDEARPRFGLLRCREFTMKDGYSFHSSYEDLVREFNVMEQTYRNILNRLGLDFRVVEADSGAIGGSGSKEFMVLAQNGEDDILYCDTCEYAANIEVAKRAKRKSDKEPPVADAAKFHTPDQNTIEKVSKFFKIDSFYTIKAIIKKAIFKDSEEVVAFFIRGDDTLQETKALNAINALELIDANDEDLKKAKLVGGYCGIIGLPNDLRFFIDLELENEANLICGANEKDYHFVGVKVVNFKKERFADLVEAKQGDTCPKCSGVLKQTKGIEVGHIFQLGQKYSAAMNANFLDENGKSQAFFMGCYGVGVSRLVAVGVEASHDEKGIIWNRAFSPFLLDIIISNSKDTAQASFANEIYEKFKEKSVILDDRNERFGFKMKDFELMGFPYALIIGKGLEEQKVELVDRKTLEKTQIHIDELEIRLKEILG